MARPCSRLFILRRIIKKHKTKAISAPAKKQPTPIPAAAGVGKPGDVPFTPGYVELDGYGVDEPKPLLYDSCVVSGESEYPRELLAPSSAVERRLEVGARI